MAKYKKKLDADIRCLLEYGLTIFGGKWKSRIICVLSTQKTLRYSEIRTEMYNITDAVLAATLKELIADGIVNRRSFDEIPPRVEYPQKLYKALMNSQTVLTVWDDARLVGSYASLMIRKCSHRFIMYLYIRNIKDGVLQAGKI